MTQGDDNALALGEATEPRVGHRARRIAARFSSLDAVWLAARMIAWALVLPLLKRLLPVRLLVPMMRRDPSRHTRETAIEDRIICFSRWAARLVRWSTGGNCLERGLIAYRYLCAAGAAPVLVVGIARDGEGLSGHAWVLVDGRPAGETESALAAYRQLVAFRADGSMKVQQ